MMKKRIVLLLFLILSVTLFTITNTNTYEVYANESYLIGEDVNFSNSLGQGKIKAELLEDGSIKTIFKTDEPPLVRYYYSASNEEIYYVNLNDFTLKMSIDNMNPNASYWISFLKQYDDYPAAGFGTGLGFLMQDENNGSYIVKPLWFPSGMEDSSRLWYLNMDNNTRPNYLTETFTFISKENPEDESEIIITISFDNGTDGAINYQTKIEKSLFTELGMNVESVVFMLGVSNNNGDDFAFTIHELTDINTKEYQDQIGTHAQTVIESALALEADDNIDVNDIKHFYQIKKEISQLSNLRKSDRYFKGLAETKINELADDFSSQVIENKDELFGLYDEEFVVTEENLDDAQDIVFIYFENKELLNDQELDSLITLLQAKIVAFAYSDEIELLETSIEEFLEKYQVVDAKNYLEAKDEYAAILREYNNFNEQIRIFVENGQDLIDFANKLNSGKDLYYSNEGTYWTNFSEGRFVRSIKTEAGTKLILVDSHGDSRAVFGDDENAYPVSIEDFQLKFIINALENTGRFSFNFGESRDIFPNAEVGKLGLTVMLRSTSANSIDVALKDTSNDKGLTFGNPLDEWGKYGTLIGDKLRDVEITMTFTKVETDYKLVFTVEDGNGFEVLIPEKYFNDRGLDVNNLFLNVTTGEGINHNNGKDIELTIVEISGKNEVAYQDTLDKFIKDLTALEEAYTKILSLDMTSDNIELFNTSKLTEDLLKIRAIDKEGLTSRLEAIDYEKANSKISEFLNTKLNALPTTVTEDNYEAIKTAITEIEALLAVLTDEQKEAVDNLTLLETIKEEVAEYEEDEEIPEEPNDEEPKKGNTNTTIIILSIVSAIAVIGVAGYFFIIRKRG